MTSAAEHPTVPPGFADLLARRSVAKLLGPEPSDNQIDLLLQLATTVPDHGELTPWRFVVVTGSGREVFGDALAGSAAEHNPGLTDAQLDKTRAKPLIAPVVIAIIASPRESPKIQVWEQLASAACTGFAIVLAAHVLGLGAVWKSTPFQRGESLCDVLSLTTSEQLLGWVNVGWPGHDPSSRPRARVAVKEVATVLDGAGAVRPFDVGTLGVSTLSVPATTSTDRD